MFKTQNVEEMMEKLKDPRYFIERFFYIVDKDRLKVPFKLNRVQGLYYSNRSQYDLILKARKEGVSSLIAAIWTHACLFIPNSRAVIVSHEDEATQRLFAKVKYYLDNMGVGQLKFKVDLDVDSRKQLSFPGTGSSFWLGTAGARSFGRGDDITHLLLSEVPHYTSQEMLTGVLEACTNQAYRVMESTANGQGEAFHRLWKESKDPNLMSPWKRHFFAWYDDPQYQRPLPTGVQVLWNTEEIAMRNAYKLSWEQMYWYKQKKASQPDKSLMAQEFPGNDREAFISSGRPVFNPLRLAEMEDRILEETRARENRGYVWKGEVTDDGSTVSWVNNPDGALQVWKMPRPRDKFLIGADVAEGVREGCYSVAKVFNRSTWECIAQWRGWIDPGAFGQILCDLGFFFNNAVLVPEMNNHGWATIERIKSNHYPHLLNTRELWPEGEMEKWGFPTNEKTKNLIFSALNNSIEDRTYIEHDILTVQEMQALVRDEKGKIVSNDKYLDTCIAAAIGVYCLKFMTVDETYRPQEKDVSERALVTSSITPRRDGTGRNKSIGRAGYR